MYEKSNFTRFFKNVTICRQLNWQEKALLSIMISYQLDGKEFKLKDATLAYELGLDISSVGKFIRHLWLKGVIDKETEPIPDPNGGKPKSQRTVTVLNIEMWVTSNNAPVLNMEAFLLYSKEKKERKAANAGKSDSIETANNKEPKQPDSIKAEIENTAFNNEIKVETNEVIPNVGTVTIYEAKPDSIELNKAEITDSEQYISTEHAKATSNKIESAEEPISTETVLEVKENHSTSFDVKKYLSPKKLEWLSKYLDDDQMTKIFSCNKLELDKMFYDENDIWIVDAKDNSKKLILQNINRVNYYYSGYGTRIKLFLTDENDIEIDSYQIEESDFDAYLDKRNITFGSITQDNFDTLRQYQKQGVGLSV